MSTDPARLAALEEWITDKEGENLEFKSVRNNFHFDELPQYCVALANEGRGRIILGVTDERPRQIVGSKAFTQPERTRKGLCEAYAHLTLVPIKPHYCRIAVALLSHYLQISRVFRVFPIVDCQTSVRNLSHSKPVPTSN